MNSKPALGRPATMQSGSYKSALERIADLEKALSEVAEELEGIRKRFGTATEIDMLELRDLAKQIRTTIGKKVE